MLIQRQPTVRLAASLLAAVPSACDSLPPVTYEERPIEEALEVAGSIRFLSDPVPPPTIVAGLDVFGDTVAIADPTSGEVRVYRRDGSFDRIVASQGEGPGELISPVLPRFSPTGRLFVVDAGPKEIVSVETGETIPLGNLLISDWEVLSDSSFLLAGERPLTTDYLLRVVDASGTEVLSGVPLAGIHPRRQRDGIHWNAVRRAAFTLFGDSLALVVSLSDSIWTIPRDLRGGRSSPLSPPNRVPPSGTPEGGPSALDWMQSFDLFQSIHVVEGRMIVGYSRGPGMLQESTKVAIEASPTAFVITEIPGFPVAVVDDELWVTTDADEDSFTITRYRIHQPLIS